MDPTVSFFLFPAIVESGGAVISFIDQQSSDHLSEYKTGYSPHHR